MLIKQADEFGWGPKTAKLDLTKCRILDKYVVGKKILDIGAATGVYSKYLEKKKKSVIAADLEYELLKHALNKYRVVADLSSPPFKKKIFDTTILFDVLEHVDEAHLKQLITITKKRIIMTLPRTTDIELQNSLLIFKHHLDTTHKRTYTKKSARILIKKFNLKEVKIVGTHPVPVKALLGNVFTGPKLLLKLLNQYIRLLKSKKFYSNLAIVADI